MSNWTCPVVFVRPRPHPNADSLGLVNVWGYQCCVQLKDFPFDKDTKAVFIPPDSVVPDTGDWAFLSGHRRIKCRKFRGERSEGIVVPYSGRLGVGDDASGELGIVKWESPADRAGDGYDIHGQKQGRKNFRLRWWSPRSWYWWFVDRHQKRQSKKAAPPFTVHKYDVENIKRYPVISKGEQVIVTEKIHGTNARFVYSSRSKRFHLGSHTMWKRLDLPSWWSHAVEQNGWIRKLCEDNPDVVFYGEIYGGSIQTLDYGKPKGELGLRLFDIYEPGVGWASWQRVKEYWWKQPGVMVNWVPRVYEGPYVEELIRSLAEGKETVSGLKLHIKEGVVVETVEPRTEAYVGRVKLKCINPAYLEEK